MKNRPLLPTLLTAVLLLIVLNWFMGTRTRKMPYFRKLEVIRTAPYPNLLFVGNSLLDGRLDEKAFEKTPDGNQLRPLNAALGASLPPEQRLLFNYAVQTHKGIQTLVAGMYDFQLTATDTSRVEDLTGNRLVAVDQRFPIGEVAAAYGFDAVQRFKLQLLRQLPMAANRTNIWKQVEILRRRMGKLGMPPEESDSFGRAADFIALESQSVDAFDAEAGNFVAKADEFNPSYEAIFGQARQAGMRVVIVVMPMSPYHRAVFYSRPAWHAYLAALAGLAKKRGIEVIDASQWLPSEDQFNDHLHMSREAAHDFSVRLAGELGKDFLGEHSESRGAEAVFR